MGKVDGDINEEERKAKVGRIISSKIRQKKES